MGGSLKRAGSAYKGFWITDAPNAFDQDTHLTANNTYELT